jgi:O-antigen/teichoic acid export membrane protein
VSKSFTVGFPILAIAYAIGAGSTFLLSVVLGRSLGASALGTFALANSIARIFYAATDFGTAPHVTRTVARDRARGLEILSIFVSLRVFLIPVAVCISCGFALVSGQDDLAVFALVALGQGLLTLQIVYEALIQAHDKQPAAALLAVLMSSAVVTSSLIWFFFIGGLLEFATMYVAALAIGIATWAIWTRARLGLRPYWRLPASELKSHIRTSWPIGLSFLLSNAALRAPVLVLGAFGDSAEVGAFAAVDMFVTAATILQSAVTNATFPTLAASYRHEPTKFRRTLWLSNALLAAIGLLVAVTLFLFGGPIFRAVFSGKEFGRATDLLSVIAWSTPILLLVHHNIYTFAASDNERLNVRFMTIWFGVIMAGQLALVPWLGLAGAAWGLLISRSLGCVVLVRALLAARIHSGGRHLT